MKVWTPFLAFSSALLLRPALSQQVLDQEYNPPILESSTGIGHREIGNTITEFDRAQTFTVGVTGMLTEVQFVVNSNPNSLEDLLLDIRTSSNGVPTEPNTGGNVLASVSIPQADVPVGTSSNTFVAVDLTAHLISVAKGDILAIVLRSNGLVQNTFPYFWKGTVDDGYSGGQLFFRFTNQSWEPSVLFDAAFRTFISPTSNSPTQSPTSNSPTQSPTIRETEESLARSLTPTFPITSKSAKKQGKRTKKMKSKSFSPVFSGKSEKDAKKSSLP